MAITSGDSMNHLFKTAIEWMATGCNVQLSRYKECFVTARTGSDDILNLIQAVRPVVLDRPLIRLGPRGDGGYLVVDDLDGVAACFSPGVSTISGFEEALAVRGMRVFLADASVAGPAVNHPRFEFLKKYIGAISTADFVTMEDWVNASLPHDRSSDLLLQMDIEGYEYEALLSTPAPLLRRFRQIIVEFHHLEQLWSRPFFDIASRVFRKLTQYHSCVHIHPNNCCGDYDYAGIRVPRVAEFTFARNDRSRVISSVAELPNPLDHDNTALPHVRLHQAWYRSPDEST
jgi:hypothetical protein